MIYLQLVHAMHHALRTCPFDEQQCANVLAFAAA